MKGPGGEHTPAVLRGHYNSTSLGKVMDQDENTLLLLLMSPPEDIHGNRKQRCTAFNDIYSSIKIPKPTKQPGAKLRRTILMFYPTPFLSSLSKYEWQTTKSNNGCHGYLRLLIIMIRISLLYCSSLLLTG